ncbi:hypothetical protein RNF46_003197 [Citrobacter freundii]|uniref:hypothetical protein n=1 Tax=Citrobacter sp. Cpo073 TaxID=2985134 RepID=UPI00257788B7|nr:hypothetical protein [Citrobacter sp. Cpo073]ELF4153222.1 hypothetical protein [Citrobacter freundii]MDM2863138.1 hypothetical protein [Citrobacter sp. Cpo073]
MKEYFESIQRCVDDHNYHAAMFLALSIPDICGGLQYPEIKSKGERARKWFAENMKEKYFPDNLKEHFLATFPQYIASMSSSDLEALKTQQPGVQLTPQIFWHLRNAFLHEASDQANSVKIHITHSTSNLCLINDAIQISAMVFPKDMSLAGLQWLERMKDDGKVWSLIISRAKIKNDISSGLFL